MKRVRASIEIEASASIVWSLLVEFRHWPTWGPTVRAVKVDSAAVAAGVRGQVQTPVGLWLPFEITTAEPERYWDWKVAGLAATEHSLTPINDLCTLVEFTVSGWFTPYLIVLNAGLRRLKLLAETA